MSVDAGPSAQGGARPAREADLRARLLGPERPRTRAWRLWSWLGPGLITLVGGVLRFWDLGKPHQLVFDETYYVKQGVSMLRYGVEMRVEGKAEDANKLFEAGKLTIWSVKDGDLAVHPPFGKWAIAGGEWLFGPQSSFGWRFTVAALGTVSILLIGRIALRLFGSVALACLASFLLAFEGLHFTLSRVGLLDMVLSFLVLAAFGALLLDRDRSRAILARKVGALPEGTWPGRYGPSLGLRPWRWVAGLCLGLATSTKFSGLVFLGMFGLMTMFWDLGARRAAGVRRFGMGALLKDGPIAALSMLLWGFAVYLATWIGWFRTDTGYHRHWDRYNPGQGIRWLPSPLRNWAHYQYDMYSSAKAITSSHPYMSNPWGWFVQARPTSMYYEGRDQGVAGCAAKACSSAINPIGTISLWWPATIALVLLVWLWAARRDWRAGALLGAIVAGWGPWFLYQERTVFSFYAVAFEPYAVLGVVLVVGYWLARPAPDVVRRRRMLWLTAYGVATLVLFAFFWPVYTAQVIPYEQWHIRMWFPGWV